MTPVAHRVVSRVQETADTWTLELESLDVIREPTLVQFVKRRDLVIVRRHDKLSAMDVRYVVSGAELIHQPAPLDAETGFQAPTRVVKAGVNDAAVVRARVEPWTRMAFEHACRQSTRRNGARGRQARDTRPDNGNIDGFHSDELPAPIVPRGTIPVLFRGDR